MATLACSQCGLDKPLTSYTPYMQRDIPCVAEKRLCVDCREKNKAKRADERRQNEKRKRQETKNKFVTVEFPTAQYLRLGPSTRTGDQALAEGGRPLKRVKLTSEVIEVTAPKDASTRATAMTVLGLRTADAVVPAAFRDDALVLFPCGAKQFTRGNKFSVSWALVDGEEVRLKTQFWVTEFDKDNTPVVEASELDLTLWESEDDDAMKAANERRGTVERVWLDGERNHAALKALAIAGNWDEFLAACGEYVEGRRPASFESFNVRVSR